MTYASPRPWQIRPTSVIADALRKGQSVLDASDTGLGKTFQCLFAFLENGLRPAVVCPKSVIPAWKEAAKLVGVKPYFVRNIESLKHDSSIVRKRFGLWMKLPDDVRLVFDEVHRFSNPGTQNTLLLANAPRPVVMLSATAIQDPTRMRAIGAQLGILKWADWLDWAARNGCKKSWRGALEFMGEQHHLDAIHQQIFSTGRGVRVRVDDLPPGTLPENRVHTRLLPVEDLEALDEAYHEELKALEEEAPNAQVAMIRARQIAEHLMVGAVIEWVNDLLAEGNSVVVFVNFKETLQHFRMNFGNLSIIEGGQTADEREMERWYFQQNENRVCVCMNQAGGIGIGLQDLTGDAPRVAIHLPGWSAIDFVQCLGRIPRDGGKSPCVQYVCFADGSLAAERVRPKLERKLNNIRTINDGDMTL